MAKIGGKGIKKAINPGITTFWASYFRPFKGVLHIKEQCRLCSFELKYPMTTLPSTHCTWVKYIMKPLIQLNIDKKRYY